MFRAKIENVSAVKFKTLIEKFGRDGLIMEELGKYERKFHPEHYFFIIKMRKIEPITS